MGLALFIIRLLLNKKGVQTAKEVSASQIVGVRVRFIPEVERDVNSKVVTRSMVDNNICWEEWGKTATSGGNTDSGNTGGDGGIEGDPLG